MLEGTLVYGKLTMGGHAVKQEQAARFVLFRLPSGIFSGMNRAGGSAYGGA
jgi:hypothetical protein